MWLFDDPIQQARALEQVDHRPWPVPREGWRMAQTWRELLFAHWPVPAAQLAALLPPGLELDTHDGTAWLGVVACRVTGLRLRGTFPMPYVSQFPQVSLRVYVQRDGRPGIWHFSLDTSSRAAIVVARMLYHLPYYHALAELRRADGGDTVFVSERLDEFGGSVSARYRPYGQAFTALPGSLEHFLCERYCLYSVNADGELGRADIHHPPWKLRHARGHVRVEAPEARDIVLPTGDSPLLHFAGRQDVVLWPSRRLVAPSGHSGTPARSRRRVVAQAAAR